MANKVLCFTMENQVLASLTNPTDIAVGVWEEPLEKFSFSENMNK